MKHYRWCKKYILVNADSRTNVICNIFILNELKIDLTEYFYLVISALFL